MKRDEDSTLLAAARAAFVDESPPTLARLEEALLVIDSTSYGARSLDAALEATRALEGSAELCHCDAIAGLARGMHRLLELLRAQKLRVTDEIAAVLLAGRDQIEAQTADLRHGTPNPVTRARTEQLQQVLRGLSGTPDGTAGGTEPSASDDDRLPGVGVAAPSTDGAWHVSARFQPDAPRQGIDPMLLLNQLGKVGQIWQIATIVDDVPPLEALEPEACYFGLEIRLGTHADRLEIDKALETVDSHASIELLAPSAKAVDFDLLLHQRCGDDEAARSRLLWIWLTLGVNLRLRDEPAVGQEAAAASCDTGEDESLLPVAPVSVSVPKIERRTESTRDRRLVRRDRRVGEEPEFVNVRAEKLEQLVDLLGELATASSGAQAAARHESSSALQVATLRVTELAQGACEGALALQRVPVGRSFAAFHAVVDDMARALGKRAELSIGGAEIDVDATMADVLADALMHVLRNSLEHGIELPDERVAMGKPAAGQLKLVARESAGSIVVEWSDDGRGVDAAALVHRAAAAALVPAGADIDDAEAWQLAFAPGLPRTGADGARRRHGAGLDAVKRNVESLRGRISLSSSQGLGTTTQIRLPLSMNMIDGVLVLVGDSYYVVPLSAVDEVTEPPALGMQDVKAACGTVELRGDTLPCLDLGRFCGCEVREQPRRRSLVIVRDGATRAALVVDRVLGRQHAMLKPLAGFLSHLKTLAGSTVLGSGDIGLVLDIPGIVAAATMVDRSPVR